MTDSTSRTARHPVKAAENGVVVYAGNELRGFGNLLLICHSDGWVSAHAHCDTLLRKRGKPGEARTGDRPAVADGQRRQPPTYSRAAQRRPGGRSDDRTGAARSMIGLTAAPTSGKTEAATPLAKSVVDGLPGSVL